MNNQEAKFILGSYRPNGRDASDPFFAEALTQAQQDPALGVWLAREQAHDTVIAEKLGAIAPPAGLREALLTGGRVSRRRRPGWRLARWLPLAAAAVAILAVSAVLWQRHAPADSPLVEMALNDLASESQHRGHGEAAGSLQATLQDPSKPLMRSLPINFAALEKTGCRTLNVAGHPVLEVCFQRNGAWFHCYIARVADFPLMSSQPQPEFAAKGKGDAITWVDGPYRLVVASLAGRDALERLL